MRLATSNSVPPSEALRQRAIGPNTIPYLIHELFSARATGILTVSDRDVRKTVTFRNGRILFAASNDRDDRLGQILLQARVLSLKDLLCGLEFSLASGIRLGEALFREDLLARADVVNWVKAQVREVVLSIFQWTSGQFIFEKKSVRRGPIILDVIGDRLVVEGIRTIRSWARMYEEVGGLNTEYMVTSEMPRITQGLPIMDEETELLKMCSAPTSLGEMCEASQLGDFVVCRSVWTLLILGAVVKS